MHGTRGFPAGLFAAVVLSATELGAEPPDLKSNLHPVHSISPEIRQAVTAKLPKYAPVTAEKPEVSGQTPPPNSPDIFYLPKLTVKAAAPTNPTDFAFLTPKGRLDLAMKSYQGLGIGNLFGLNGGVAMAMQAEQRDVDKKAALVEAVERTTSDDGPDSKKTMRLLKEALHRPNNDWASYRGPMKRGDDR